MLATFPQWSEEFISEQLTGAQSWAYYAWAVEEAAARAGAKIKRREPGGYVHQEYTTVFEKLEKKWRTKTKSKSS